MLASISAIALAACCGKAYRQEGSEKHFGEWMMKTGLFRMILCIVLLALLLIGVGARSDESLTLVQIGNNIDQYRGKTVKMVLRLKYVDTVFDAITFYDSRNHDIVFDVSGLKNNNSFKREILNLHEGMSYRVSFTVKGVGNLGEVIGTLQHFEVMILERLHDSSP